MAALPNDDQSSGFDGESGSNRFVHNFSGFETDFCKDILIGTLVYRASASLSLAGSGESHGEIEVSPLFSLFIVDLWTDADVGLFKSSFPGF